MPVTLLSTGDTETQDFQAQSSQTDGAAGREVGPSWKLGRGAPKPVPSKVFLDKVTLELNFKGRVGVSQAKPSHGEGTARATAPKWEAVWPVHFPR